MVLYLLAALLSAFCLGTTMVQATTVYYTRYAPPPPFLARMNHTAREEYKRIVTSDDTKQQILARLDTWAADYHVTAQYNNFTAREQNRAKAMHDEVAGNLTGQAAQLFEQIWNILHNESLTRVAECQQINALLNASAAMVRQMVQPQLPRPTIFGPPPTACLPPHPPPRPMPLCGGPALGAGGPGMNPGGPIVPGMPAMVAGGPAHDQPELEHDSAEDQAGIEHDGPMGPFSGPGGPALHDQPAGDEQNDNNEEHQPEKKDE